jgi:hypothetical protein
MAAEDVPGAELTRMVLRRALRARLDDPIFQFNEGIVYDRP